MTSRLIDAGVGRRPARGGPARDRGITALGASRLTRVFITHLHSDHTLGLPDRC
jgi:glyoxylase-like metal-dependent hydrolase (beta-lactamase superfamily II)